MRPHESKIKNTNNTLNVYYQNFRPKKENLSTQISVFSRIENKLQITYNKNNKQTQETKRKEGTHINLNNIAFIYTQL